MLSKLQSLFGKNYTTKIVNLSDKIKILCESKENDQWNFSYFILGSHGNYLFWNS